MIRSCVACFVLSLLAGCGRQQPPVAHVDSKAFGSALVEVSGGKQMAATGTAIEQPLVVQVNDAQGAPLAGAAISFHTSGGAAIVPAEGLTGSDGQLSVSVMLGGIAGRYQILATTLSKTGKEIELRSEEIALGYQQNLGRLVNDRYCARCHDSESTAQRVSNHDNLKAAPHALTDGAILNHMSDADLLNIIAHGGPAIGKSAEMPPYGATLQKSEIDALVAFIRAGADPPYRLKGLVYAKN